MAAPSCTQDPSFSFKALRQQQVKGGADLLAPYSLLGLSLWERQDSVWESQERISED